MLCGEKKTASLLFIQLGPGGRWSCFGLKFNDCDELRDINQDCEGFWPSFVTDHNKTRTPKFFVVCCLYIIESNYHLVPKKTNNQLHIDMRI